MIGLIYIIIITLVASIGSLNLHHYFIRLFNPKLTYLIGLNRKPIYYLLKAILLFVCTSIMFYLVIKFNILTGNPPKSKELPPLKIIGVY